MASRDKEAAMDGLLRRSLSEAARAGEAVKDCPPADLLAAYYERSLDATEMARYDLHFSQCARCREQLAALVRADESAGSEAKKGVSGWGWLMHQWWLVPAAGTLALAVVVSIGVWTRTRHVAAPATSEVAMSKQESPAPTPQDYVATTPSGTPAEEHAKKSASVPATTKSGANTRVQNGGVERLKKYEADAIEPKADKAVARTAVAEPTEGAALPASAAKGTNAATVRARTAAAPAATANRAAAARAKASTAAAGRAFADRGLAAGVTADRAGAARTATTTAQQATHAQATASAAPPPTNKSADMQVQPQTEAVMVTEEAPPAKPEAKEGAQAAPASAAPALAPPPQQAGVQGTPPEANQQSAKALRLERSAPDALNQNQISQQALPSASQAVAVTASAESAVITTPDPRSLWRIAEGGFVEHSENGGTTWTGTQPVADAQWAAGAAPAARTCWLVGRDGVIAVTTDAVHWKIVTPPAQTDFAGVTATNGREAIVTTADGKKFSTRNAGKSWQQVP